MYQVIQFVRSTGAMVEVVRTYRTREEAEAYRGRFEAMYRQHGYYLSVLPV